MRLRWGLCDSGRGKAEADCSRPRQGSHKPWAFCNDYYTKLLYNNTCHVPQLVLISFNSFQTCVSLMYFMNENHILWVNWNLFKRHNFNYMVWQIQKHVYISCRLSFVLKTRLNVVVQSIIVIILLANYWTTYNLHIIWFTKAGCQKSNVTNRLATYCN